MGFLSGARGRIRDQIDTGVVELSPDGLLPAAQMARTKHGGKPCANNKIQQDDLQPKLQHLSSIRASAPTPNLIWRSVGKTRRTLFYDGINMLRHGDDPGHQFRMAKPKFGRGDPAGSRRTFYARMKVPEVLLPRCWHCPRLTAH